MTESKDHDSSSVKDPPAPPVTLNGKIESEVPKVLVSEPTSPVDDAPVANGVDPEHHVASDGVKTPEGMVPGYLLNTNIHFTAHSIPNGSLHATAVEDGDNDSFYGSMVDDNHIMGDGDLTSEYSEYPSKSIQFYAEITLIFR